MRFTPQHNAARKRGAFLALLTLVGMCHPVSAAAIQVGECTDKLCWEREMIWWSEPPAPDEKEPAAFLLRAWKVGQSETTAWVVAGGTFQDLCDEDRLCRLTVQVPAREDHWVSVLAITNEVESRPSMNAVQYPCAIIESPTDDNFHVTGGWDWTHFVSVFWKYGGPGFSAFMRHYNQETACVDPADLEFPAEMPEVEIRP